MKVLAPPFAKPLRREVDDFTISIKPSNKLKTPSFCQTPVMDHRLFWDTALPVAATFGMSVASLQY